MVAIEPDGCERAAVEREAGFHAIDRAWESPELLPTLDELSAPTTWLARVDGVAVATR